MKAVSPSTLHRNICPPVETERAFFLGFDMGNPIEDKESGKYSPPDAIVVSPTTYEAFLMVMAEEARSRAIPTPAGLKSLFPALRGSK